jgi:ribosomal RNA methyltransferase Nop2
MGRKVNFAEKPKKGPGKKAKKQPAPKFSKKLLGTEETSVDLKKLSHRQKQRFVKRSARKEKLLTANANAIAKKKLQHKQKKENKYESSNESEEEGSDDEQMESDEDIQQVEKSMKKGFKQVKTPVEESDESDDENQFASDDEEDSDGSDVMPDNFDEASDSDDEEEEPSNKRKRDILADSDDDSEQIGSDEQESDEDTGDDSDDDKKLPIEKASKKLKIQKEKDDKLAEDELQLNIADKEKFSLDEALDVDKALNLQDVQQRIKDVVAILMDFSANRDPTRSRAEYVDVLKKDLCTYYSYNDFLMQTLMDVFPVNELVEFLESSEVQRPLTIRTNSLKTRRRDLAQALINRGVNLDPVGKWSKVGLTVYSSQVPLGATPEYLAGHYIIQGASSMLPVMALAPQENERVLDMCAAPGGKSTHIAAIMKNTGVLFSNDVNKDRIHAIVGNFHRLGIINSVVTCVNGIEYKKFIGGFDRVLLDAPCSGSGVISKDPSVKTSKTQVDVQRCYNLQRKLIISAIDCLSAKSKSGGYLVYSTCSILPEENEWVVDYALKKRNVRLVPTGLDFGTEGFTSYREKRYHPSMKLTRRYYPHTHNMDGFFVAKLQKISDTIPENDTEDVEDEEQLENEEENQEGKKKRVDKRDWFQKDLEEMKKKPEDPVKKQNYVTNVFEKPVKTDKTKKTKKMSSHKTELIQNLQIQHPRKQRKISSNKTKLIQNFQLQHLKKIRI